MRKKLAATLFLITIAILAINLLTGKERLYSELCISGEEKQEIVGGRVLAEDALFTKILFNEYELMYDSAGNRLFYSLIENQNSAYDPYVECVSEIEDVNIAIVGTTITKEIITNGQEFEILVYTDEEYQTAKLVFTTLPLLSVDYDGEMGEEETKQFEFKLFDNRQYATQRVIEADGEIRIRGRYTRNFPKLGYRITLYEDSVGGNRRERDVSLLGMRQDGDWILYAGYNDQEKIRNVFSSKLWKESCATNNQLGLDNGMEYKYVELFLQGQYWGLYALGYPIDSQQLRLKDGEYMYKKSDPYVSEPAIDFDAPGAVFGYEIKELGVNTEESWEPLKQYYKAMLYGDEQYSQLSERVDIGNSLDIFLFINLIQGVDHANLRGENIVHNIYMTNKIGNDESEIMLYTPWDMDRTWGSGLGDYDFYKTAPDQNILMQTNIVYLLLEQDDANMKEMLVQRYQELRESVWSDEYLMNLTYLYEEQIFNSGAFARDKGRWPEGIYINEQHKLNLFRRHILDRMQYMDAFISQYR